MAVSVRHQGHQESFLTDLIPELSGLIWRTTGRDLMNLQTIQALILLATWPLPDVHMWTDRSLVMANLALTAAQMLGLHRSGSEHEYSKRPTTLDRLEVSERRITWFALVALSAR